MELQTNGHKTHKTYTKSITNKWKTNFTKQTNQNEMKERKQGWYTYDSHQIQLSRRVVCVLM